MQKTSAELRQERAESVNTAKYIAKKAKQADRVMNDEEIKETAELTTNAKELEDQIISLERAEQAMDDIDNLDAGAISKAVRQTPPDITHGTARSNDDETFTIPATYKRCGKLRAFKGPDAERDAYISGMWLAATIYKNRRADLWCQRHGVYERFAQEEGTAGAGGNLVPDPLLQAVIDNREAFGSFRSNTRVIPMSSDVISIPRVSGSITASFFGESATIAESDKSWDLVQLTAQKLAVITRISSELNEDAILSVADSVAFDMARAMALKEDQVGWAGTGIAADGAIVGVYTAFDNDTTLTGNVQAAMDELDEIVNADIALLMGALPSYALPGAKFYCSNNVFQNVLLRLAAVGGGNVYQTLQDGSVGLKWAGYPVVIQNSTTLTVTDSSDLVFLLFGDLSRASVMGDKRGISIASSSDIYFTQDQIALRATERIDINIHDIGDGSTAGPIVGLRGAT